MFFHSLSVNASLHDIGNCAIFIREYYYWNIMLEGVVFVCSTMHDSTHRTWYGLSNSSTVHYVLDTSAYGPSFCLCGSFGGFANITLRISDFHKQVCSLHKIVYWQNQTWFLRKHFGFGYQQQLQYFRNRSDLCKNSLAYSLFMNFQNKDRLSLWKYLQKN